MWAAALVAAGIATADIVAVGIAAVELVAAGMAATGTAAAGNPFAAIGRVAAVHSHFGVLGTFAVVT